jgi:hypothetical protein
LSAQVTTQAWTQTAAIFASANTLLENPKLLGPYRFRWQPNIYDEWPDFETLCGFRFDNPSVLAAGLGPKAKTPGPTRIALLWQPARGAWAMRMINQ